MMYIFNIIEIEELSIGDDGNPMIWTQYLEEQYLETYYCSMYWLDVIGQLTSSRGKVLIFKSIFM